MDNNKTQTTVTYTNAQGEMVSRNIVGAYDSAWRAKAEVAGTLKGCKNYVWSEAMIVRGVGLKPTMGISPARIAARLTERINREDDGLCVRCGSVCYGDCHGK